ncbi:MAG TPA: TaqI-like C-terminal specificity domain-containing protein, partial [Spirochaetota bacterium]|nr:TaqI-like C-terminal specificity domain-containing protein [Spirochaetota bacterium]
YIFEINNLSNKLKNNNKKLGEVVEITRGLEIGKDKISKEETNRKIIFGEDIGKYVIKNINFIDEGTYQNFKKNDDIFKQEKIMIRETGNKLTVAYDNNGLLTNRSLYCIRSKDFDLFYLLGILNSRLIQYYYENQYKSDTDIFPKIRIGQVKEIPIPDNTDRQIINQIIVLVKEMIQTQKNICDAKSDSDKSMFEKKINMINDKIDKLVYNLYGLTEDDIKTIEGE